MYGKMNWQKNVRIFGIVKQEKEALYLKWSASGIEFETCAERIEGEFLSECKIPTESVRTRINIGYAKSELNIKTLPDVLFFPDIIFWKLLTTDSLSTNVKAYTPIPRPMRDGKVDTIMLPGFLALIEPSIKVFMFKHDVISLQKTRPVKSEAMTNLPKSFFIHMASGANLSPELRSPL